VKISAGCPIQDTLEAAPARAAPREAVLLSSGG